MTLIFDTYEIGNLLACLLTHSKRFPLLPLSPVPTQPLSLPFPFTATKQVKEGNGFVICHAVRRPTSALSLGKWRASVASVGARWMFSPHSYYVVHGAGVQALQAVSWTDGRSPTNVGARVTVLKEHVHAEKDVNLHL